jgi:membrane protein implicated in regulation of membrane protease activity
MCGWRLIRGNGWRAAAIIIFSVATIFGPSLLLSFIKVLMGDIGSPLVELLLYQISMWLLSPISGIAAVLLYYDCRIRHEALDLETMAKKLDTPDEDSVPAVEAQTTRRL